MAKPYHFLDRRTQGCGIITYCGITGVPKLTRERTYLHQGPEGTSTFLAVDASSRGLKVLCRLCVDKWQLAGSP